MPDRIHDYHEGNRFFHDRFDTRRLADAWDERTTEFVDDFARGFIQAADFFFLATCDHRGLPTLNYKGGDPGFVRVLDDRTLAFPNYDGNGRYHSMGNLLKNPNVALLFIDFENPRRLKVQGAAEVRLDDELLSEYTEAQFIVRVTTTEVFRNCPRYIHKYQRLDNSPFVPREGCETPITSWKLQPNNLPLLPANDPARTHGKNAERQ